MRGRVQATAQVGWLPSPRPRSRSPPSRAVCPRSRPRRPPPRRALTSGARRRRPAAHPRRARRRPRSRRAARTLAQARPTRLRQGELKGVGSLLVGGGVRESLGACLPDRATEGHCIGASGRRLARSRHTWPSICASVSDAPVPTAASWKRRQCGEMPRLKRRETSAMKMTWARARTRARAGLGARLRARDWGKD